MFDTPEITLSDVIQIALCRDDLIERRESFLIDFRILVQNSPLVTYIPTITEATVLINDATGMHNVVTVYKNTFHRMFAKHIPCSD